MALICELNQHPVRCFPAHCWMRLRIGFWQLRVAGKRIDMSQEKKKQKGPSAEPEVMEKIVSLCKQRGFVFQSSEIYGGLKSCYDYGPLGAELKRNVKAEWWRTMVHDREDVVGIDASIIMHPNVWPASGHLAGFTAPMVQCKD